MRKFQTNILEKIRTYNLCSLTLCNMKLHLKRCDVNGGIIWARIQTHKLMYWILSFLNCLIPLDLVQRFTATIAGTEKLRNVLCLYELFIQIVSLTLIPLMWRMWWGPNNASRWQMGFNAAFKGLKVSMRTGIFFCFSAHSSNTHEYLLSIYCNWQIYFP
jgi:hypothetical protein